MSWHSARLMDQMKGGKIGLLSNIVQAVYTPVHGGGAQLKQRLVLLLMIFLGFRSWTRFINKLLIVMFYNLILWRTLSRALVMNLFLFKFPYEQWSVYREYTHYSILLKFNTFYLICLHFILHSTHFIEPR